MEYQLKLRVDTDTKSLDKLDRKLDSITKKAIEAQTRLSGMTGVTPASAGGRSSAGGSTRSGGVLDNLRHSGFGGSLSRFSSNFVPNLTNPVGLFRNLANLGDAFGRLTIGIGKANIAIGALSGAIGGLAMAKLIPMAVTGGQLLIGNSLLNSQALGQGSTDVMRMRMAREFLGKNYNTAVNRATGMASAFGIDRASALNTMSLLSGMNIGGGNKLSLNQAEMLTRASGKIAMMGNRPYDMVALNMQQLFGQSIPSARDIRELITAAPAISNIAQEMMSKKGVGGDFREWLQDKANLFNAISEFDRRIETTAFSRAKGQVAVAKATAMMDIVEKNSKTWEQLGVYLSKFWDEVSKVAPSAINEIMKGLSSLKVEKFANDLGAIVKYLAMAIGDVAEIARKATGDTDENLEMDKYYPILRAKRMHDLMYETTYEYPYRDPATTSFTKDFWNKAGGTEGQYGNARAEDRRYWYMKANIEASRWAKEQIKLGRMRNYDEVMKQVGGTAMDYASFFYEKYNNPENTASTANGGTAQELADLTKGSKSLIINFNKEIAPIDVRLGDVQDGTDLGERLRSIVQEAVTNGLTMALNTAGAAI